jgi:hypothetical protein
MICCSIYLADSIAVLSTGGESLTAYIVKYNKFRLFIGGRVSPSPEQGAEGQNRFGEQNLSSKKGGKKVSNDRGKMKYNWNALEREENL